MSMMKDSKYDPVLLSRALFRTAWKMGLDSPRLSNVLGVPENYLPLMQTGRMPMSDNVSVRAALLIRLYGRLDHIARGNEKESLAWLRLRNRQLNSLRPIDMIQTRAGLSKVVVHLESTYHLS